MVRLALAAIALALAVPASAEEHALTPAEFRDRVAASMTAATGNPATVIGDWTFTTKDADGQDLTINIDNVYRDYQYNPKNLATIIARFASVFGRGVEAATADQLVLIVRPLNYVEQAIPTGGATDKFPAAHPIAGDLAYFLAIDAPESIRIATLDDLKGWNLDEASAWKRAQSNLKARIGPIGFAGLEHEPAARLIVADSGLAPSILSDPALCGPASPSGLLAFVIARDSVLVAFPDDKASIRAFWKVAKPFLDAGQGLSSTAITCDDGQWTIASNPD